ncbi:glycosyltransferase family 2 protein [Caulobacter endophyticus]|uniref:glycosyltransferase family 2 protein n=1 Tax=Caulobacter endophyticus TaxID=2172652 RepID=UPI00240F2711|nr:glycosyltransferase family 2 protein [Caulobacter endophyticus]MDG2527896.1 glycosyltransferase family 2 protein [Caulobacter endophyticus]
MADLGHVTPEAGPQRSDARFHLSVMAIFRNEAHVIDEWVEHYRAFGVEHFYLIDNNSTDAYRPALQRHIDDGVVDLFICGRDAYQIGAYTEMLPRLRRETEWVGVFDLDEFIYPLDGAPIPAALAAHRDRDAILAPWLSFGSSGHLDQPASVVEGFTRRGDAAVSRAFLKAFSKPEEIEVFSQHNPVTRRGNKVLSNGQPFGDDLYVMLEEARLEEFAMVNNHYRLQSLAYFRDIKTARPEVHEEAQDRLKTMRFFHEYDAAWSRIEDRRLAAFSAARRS